MREALKALAKSPDLARLQALLTEQTTRFNVFEAIGAVRQELRHSDFLGFLLRPNATHGFGDAFLKPFLSTIMAEVPVDLSDTQVHREWKNIDLFLTNERHRFAVVIENKVDSGEHGDQLNDYLTTVGKNHYTRENGWTVIAVYLTLHGGKASHSGYSPLSYGTVCALLETFAEERKAQLDPEVLTALRHYTQLLRKHLVGDPEITKLCRDLYITHKLALELLFREMENADEQLQRRRVLNAFVSSLHDVKKVANTMHFGVNYVCFTPKSWDKEAGLLEGEDAGNFCRLLMLQFENHPNGLVDLVAKITPGPTSTREKLLESARSQEWLTDVPKTLSTYTPFYQRPLLTEDDYPADNETINELLTERWQEFLAEDYPRFANLIEPGSFPATPTP